MTPRFDTVPDHWKYPEGPYRQAPAENGGQWWLVNPFGSAEPWLTQSQKPKAEVLPLGFALIFGTRPQAKDYRGPGYPQTFQAATADWEQSLAQFKQAGPPEWATAAEIQAAGQVFEAWDMGRPYFYEGRYGWSARFPHSELPQFEVAARAALEQGHLVVAQYQLALLERGAVPEKKHPFTPPSAWPAESED